jgi:cation transport ATPase
MLIKTVFKITKMDCPSEEQIIRMKLEGIPEIKKLEFDIPNRMLEVIHEGEVNTFDSAIHSLNLGSKLESSNETDVSEIRHEDTHQCKMLWWVLVINFSFFVIEMLYGWLSRSMGLIADSLDMLADSIVYGLNLLAVGAALARKKKVARLSGYFQMILAFLGLAEVLRRFFGYEGMPCVLHNDFIIPCPKFGTTRSYSCLLAVMMCFIPMFDIIFIIHYFYIHFVQLQYLSH